MCVDGMPWVLGEGALGCGGSPRGLVSGARSLVCCSVSPACSLEQAAGCVPRGLLLLPHLLSPLQNPPPLVFPEGLAHGLQRKPGAREREASPLWISEVTASAERCL